MHCAQKGRTKGFTHEETFNIITEGDGRTHAVSILDPKVLVTAFIEVAPVFDEIIRDLLRTELKKSAGETFPILSFPLVGNLSYNAHNNRRFWTSQNDRKIVVSRPRLP